MKLKYYLRGLGIGMVVSTLILVISYNTQNKISDEEVIMRAKKLGMVMSTEDDLFGEETTSAEEPTTEESSTEQQTTKEPGTEEPTTKEPSTEEPTTEEPSTEEPTTEEPSTEEPTTEEPATEEPTTEAGGTVVEFTFTIESGMYSEAVTKMLVQGGIIKNETEFNLFLETTGYEEKIQTGVYTVNSDMTYEEIAKIISKNK